MTGRPLAGVNCGAAGGVPPFVTERGAPGAPARADADCPWALPGGPGSPDWAWTGN